MTPQEIITDARGILNDTDVLQPRNSDAELLRYVNDGLLEVAQLRPVLFSNTVSFVVVANKCAQEVPLSSGSEILEVIGLTGGAALTVFDRDAMDSFRPAWRNDTAGTPEQWAPVKSDPMRFDLYPRPSAALSVDLRVSDTPPIYALNDSVELLPDTFRPALVDYVVHRAELKDDEHVLTQRSALMYTAFLGKIGVVKGGASGSSSQQE